VKAVYCIIVKIDQDLPWIELRGEYATRREARQAARIAAGKIGFKIANVPQDRELVKALVTAGRKH
jgi:hypothetical protein